MNSSNRALLIVDVQNDYFEGGKFTLVGIDKAAQNCKRLLEHFRTNKLPIIHIQHFFVGENAPFFAPKTPGSDINEAVTPLEGEKLITKNYPSSFRETELNEYLKKSGITELVIVGAMSHMCIDTTTRAAADLGYTCQVIHDACATRDLEFNGTVVKASDVHASYMAALGFAFAKILSTEEYLR